MATFFIREPKHFETSKYLVLTFVNSSLLFLILFSTHYSEIYYVPLLGIDQRSLQTEEEIRFLYRVIEKDGRDLKPL